MKNVHLKSVEMFSFAVVFSSSESDAGKSAFDEGERIK